MTNLVKPFYLTVNNRKKRRIGSPYQEVTCTGVIFTDTNHVALDTIHLKPLYNSFEEMREALAWWGDVKIEGLEGIDESVMS